jgi:hypothetical protein
MRSPSGTVRFFVLAGSTAIALAVPAFAEEKSGKVEIKEDVIIIHPGSKISKSDTAALNEVLRKYDKSLYKIETYRSGKSKKKLGELSDMLIDQTVASELASAKESGESDRSIQVISPNGPQGPAMVPVNPQRPSSPMPTGPQMQSPMPTGPQMQSPMPTGPQMQSPMPAGPQMQSPMPAGPQMSPSSPVPSGPQMVPTGPQRSPSSPTNPQHAPTPAKPADAKAYKQLIERLKPILEKYSK